jgi:prepilin-type N-terminal cleavage/methylation domain-containing protein
MIADFRLPIADSRTGSVRRPPSSVLRRPSSAEAGFTLAEVPALSTRKAAGFTLAEVMVALAIALLITAAAASALAAVLRSERSQGQQRHAHFLASSWLASRYSGSGETPGVRLDYLENSSKDQPWTWLCGETLPARPGTPTARVWTRAEERERP